MSENNFQEINLEADDAGLVKILKKRSLGLSLDEAKKVREYFRKEKRNPTDVELEALSQAWSEHCCYKSSKPVLKRTVFKIKAPQNICVISEDAGVVDFDKEHAYVVALESHNHPSALDPYGGAATGIGGILRDVICMGSQPVALIDPLFFGPLDLPEEKLPKGTKHPRFLFKGVVSGIADYGNRVGIPTVAGMVEFDESYVTNCLVNVGCIGIIRKEDVVHSRAGAVGDIYIMAGGKTGRDGIHGVSFASAELGEESEEKDIPAVQLGYAIMKEPLMHACLEATKKKLLTGMKDFGGGGLSCVSSEMAHAGKKGAVIELDKVPLKQEGMAPWEIWVSESQERMMVTVKPEDAEKVLKIFEFWDVPAAVVGTVNESSRVKATYNGKVVLDLDLDFLLAGVSYERPFKFVERDATEPRFDMPDLSEMVLRLLNSPRIGSRESIIRRYDHEVRGNTVIKPMQGKINYQTHGDAAVLKPLEDSYKGLAITADVNPQFCRLDPYWGAASAVDETVRNLVSVGARPHSLADCLNFGNPEKPERMGELIRCCDGLYFAASAYKIPYVSGNVSLYNEGLEGPIAPTPTILGIGIVADVRKAVTADLKEAGNVIYLLGETMQEMGGSEYYRLLGLTGGSVPKVYPEKTQKSMSGLLKAMDKRLVRSCHDLSTGGLLVAAAEMAFGGDLGLDLDIRNVGGMRTDYKLFSESNSRWLVEVREKDAADFESMVLGRRVGTVTKETELKIKDSGVDLKFDLAQLRDAWDSAIGREKA